MNLLRQGQDAMRFLGMILLGLIVGFVCGGAIGVLVLDGITASDASASRIIRGLVGTSGGFLLGGLGGSCFGGFLVAIFGKPNKK